MDKRREILLIYKGSTGVVAVPKQKPMNVVHMASSNVDNTDDRISRISSSIQAFKDTIYLFVERYKDKNINIVAGVEARGFILGPPIALAIGAKFAPMRKPKKLPGEVISEEYSLEYGTDKIEMHVEYAAGERLCCSR
ncbi:hypothetical protein DH2020_007925 [Rehmannia glutinosa]|uniref:adenine phosphoribosyltransferase n=1 Tax=Rehmannia glutinosa TaxID=99300 RepID=A0ABR0TZJ2_REHGL